MVILILVECIPAQNIVSHAQVLDPRQLAAVGYFACHRHIAPHAWHLVEQAIQQGQSLLISPEGTRSHDGTLQDDGTIPKRGKFTIKITENDLLNVKEQYLKYNIYMVNASNEKTLTYSHSHFNNNATMFVNANAFPGPVATTSVDTFQETAVDSGVWASSTVDAQPAINGNEALHTAAFYTDGYVGNITVEGTLDNTVSDATNWFTISTSAFTGSETEPKPVNYTGVFSHVRFKADANPADKITQILVRN